MEFDLIYLIALKKTIGQYFQVFLVKKIFVKHS